MQAQTPDSCGGLVRTRDADPFAVGMRLPLTLGKPAFGA